MRDWIVFCVYCGDIMNCPDERQQEIFGWPKCCEHDMIKADKTKIYSIIKALDILKKKLENEIIKGL